MSTRSQYRAVLLLSIAQALANSYTSVVATISALTGQMLAADPRLATVPLGLQFVVTMAATIPVAHLMRLIGRRNAWTIVGNLQHNARAVDGGAQGHLPAFGSEFDGVVQEIARHLEQQVAVATDDKPRRDRGREFLAPFLGGRAMQIGGVFEDLAQGRWRQLLSSRALQAGQAQQGLEHGLQPTSLLQGR
jgi:hypothetical protein